ncbi:MAG: glycerophosphodiester phosphodiesterase family protein [Bacilli bacterium]
MRKIKGLLLALLLSFVLMGCEPNDGLTPEERKALKEDKISPTIIIEEGYEVLTFDVGAQIDLLLGIKGEDNLQGDITNKITIDKSGYDETKKGYYELYYFLADYAGNNATPVKRVIRLFDRQNVKLIAHRGFSAQEFDNTMEAFQAGVEANFWGLECDVRVTKDNKLVINHDDTLPGGNGLITQKTFDEIMEIEFTNSKFPGRVYKIASFYDYLLLCKENNVTPIIELKAPFTNQQIQLVIDMVETEGMMEKSVFISFQASYLQYIRNRYSDVRLQLLLGNEDPTGPIKNCLANNYAISVAYSNPTFWTQANIDKFHKAALEVAAWTVDNVNTMKELINMGVDCITSNAINTLPELDPLPVQ